MPKKLPAGAKKRRKPAADLTSKEAFRRLFPKPVRDEIDREKGGGEKPKRKDD